MFVQDLELETTHMKRVLHIAPEDPLRRKLRRFRNIEYVPGDRFDIGYAYPTGTIPLDITKLPFHEQSFDVVICNHVLEHVPDDIAAMREIYRVIRPGGTGILQVPVAAGSEVTIEDETAATPEEREAVYGQSDHCRLYGRDYLDRLRAAGFSAQAIRLQEQMETTAMNRLGINPQEELFVARRP